MQSMYERIGKTPDLFTKLLFALQGGSVRRFHTVTTIKDITVAEHQHNVAWIVYILEEGKPRMELVMAALSHDLPEVIFGDIPSPGKKILGLTDTFTGYEEGMLKEKEFWNDLTPREQHTLKLADRMGGMLDCVKERSLGNRNVELPYGRFDRYVSDMLFATSPKVHWDLYAALRQHWAEVTVRYEL